MRHFPEGYVPDYEGNYASYTSDDKFVSGIESMVEEGGDDISASVS